MTTTKQQNGRASESGNVLFLILIAVALFAALSYAVTQSSRSGGGDAGEKTLVSSSAITQYPAGVRTSIVRMIIAGVAVNDLIFDDPSNFHTIETTGSATVIATNKARAVFYPSPGGGATYQLAPPDAMAVGGQGVWIFTANFQVQNIGSTATDGTGNDLIAFLPGVAKTLCLKLNSQLGIPLVSGDAPLETINAPAISDNMLMSGTGIPTSVPGGTIGSASSAPLAGQPFGCFKLASGTYYYYHVLVER